MVEILIVDDVPANLYSLEELLLSIEKSNDIQLSIQKANSGEKALILALKKEIDLIILDIQMPTMNGFETAKYLHTKQKTKNIPIIFLTAVFKSEEFIKNGFEIGAIDYLTKPIDKELFSQKIKNYLLYISEQKKTLQLNKNLKNLSFETDLLQLILDDRARIVYYNELIEKSFPSIALDQGIYDFIDSLEDMKEEEKKAFLNYLNTINLFHDKKDISVLSYKEKYYQASFIPVKNQYLLSLKDITREIELQNKHAKLEASYQTDLEHTKEKLLMIFTHELKTPLNGIIGFSSYITRAFEKPLTPQKIERCFSLSQKVESLGRVLLSHVNSLLDLAKLKDGKIKFHYQKSSLKGIIDEFCDTYEHIYEDKEIQIDAKRIVISTDRSMMTHIFENIMTNALKHSKTKIKITLKEDEQYFYFVVEDDGEGVGKKMEKKIFELFEQGEEISLTRDRSGTGIGLHLVKRLCDVMGYTIAVEDSQILGGAKFSVIGKIKEE